MADYLVTSNDWDLEAIIRGWGGGGAAVQLPSPQGDSTLGFEGFGFDESKVRSNGDLVNELEEMYKPFMVASPSSSSFPTLDKDEMEKKEDVEDHVQPRSSSKRRKSKQKIVREIHRGVGEDGVAMDKWNWRKYGQKAIKGSPYPRSYYRCSSSAGCNARKHVEQSKDDCHTCIVTYIADHSHLPPTRRHAQAGRKITKFSTSSSAKPTPSPPSTSAMTTWTVSGPSTIVDGADHHTAAQSDMEGMFTAQSAFDQDFIWEQFDPFFTASIC